MLYDLITPRKIVSALNNIDNKNYFSIPSSLRGLYEMKVDISENSKEFIIHAELPGFSKENINVEFNDNVLTISTEEVKQKEDKDGERFLRVERSTHKRSRSFSFDVPVKEDSISAKYENGLLTLTIQKKEQIAQSKKIMIE